MFAELLEQNQNRIHRVITKFSIHRNDDAQAICDLAMYNYVEMRSLVNSPMFLIRKKLDGWLNWLMPSSWIPLYTMVTFTRTPYRECIRNKAKQDRVIRNVTMSVLTLGASFGLATLMQQYSILSKVMDCYTEK